MVITPQVFYELFLLCLSWQWKPDLGGNGMFTTVDKVVRILHGLGIISDKQKRILYKDRRTQRLFLKHSGRACPGTPIYGVMGGGINPKLMQDGIIDFPTSLVIAVNDLGDVNHLKLLQDCRIYMTHRGMAIAKSLENKYASLITSEKYLSECERQDIIFKEMREARGPFLLAQYRKNVEKKEEEAQRYT